MKWRLREGRGEAIYEIGVKDNGVLAGLSDSEIHSSLQTLEQMSLQLDATMTILREREVDDGKKVIEVLIRKVTLMFFSCPNFLNKNLLNALWSICQGFFTFKRITFVEKL